MSGDKRSSVWAKVRIQKRSTTTNTRSYGFGRNKKRHDGREEYIIKMEGFSGELRKYMTEAEAIKWVESSNKNAFMSAAKASKNGVYGVDSFTKYGNASSGTGNVIARMAARAFCDIRKKEED